MQIVVPPNGRRRPSNQSSDNDIDPCRQYWVKWRYFWYAIFFVGLPVGFFLVVPRVMNIIPPANSQNGNYHGFCAVPYDISDMDQAMLHDIRSVSMENLMAAAERDDLLRFADESPDYDEDNNSASSKQLRRDSDGDGDIDTTDMMVERLLRNIFMERFDVGTPFELRDDENTEQMRSRIALLDDDDEDDMYTKQVTGEPVHEVERNKNADGPVIDEGFSRVTVPRFRDGRNGRFLHDFRYNQSLIVDKEQSHCFVMPLDRTTVLEPRSLQELIVKLNDGSYIIDTEIVRRNMYVVMPALSDLSEIAPRILKECMNMSIYRLEEKIGNGEFLILILLSNLCK